MTLDEIISKADEPILKDPGDLAIECIAELHSIKFEKGALTMIWKFNYQGGIYGIKDVWGAAYLSSMQQEERISSYLMRFIRCGVDDKTFNERKVELTNIWESFDTYEREHPDAKKVAPCIRLAIAASKLINDPSKVRVKIRRYFQLVGKSRYQRIEYFV